jgi:hypothetical protein
MTRPIPLSIQPESPQAMTVHALSNAIKLYQDRRYRIKLEKAISFVPKTRRGENGDSLQRL